MREDRDCRQEQRHVDAYCGGAAAGGAQTVESASLSEGCRFRVAGLDCTEEGAILKKALGSRVGGDEHLAFDVLNGRMTVLESAEPISDGAVIMTVAETGMTAEPWDASSTGTDHAAHMRRQKFWTPHRSCAEADAVARRQLLRVERRLRRLEALRTELNHMIAQCSSGPIAECRVIEVLRDHSECLTKHHRE